MSITGIYMWVTGSKGFGTSLKLSSYINEENWGGEGGE